VVDTNDRRIKLNDESRTFIQEVIRAAPPAFHFWEGKPQTGGFSQVHLDFMETEIDDWKRRQSTLPKELRIVETGAGLSTLLFMSMGLQVVSFSLSDVIDRITAFLSENSIEASWLPCAGFSEFAVPRYFESQDQGHEFALIDGNHAIPSVFADFIHLSSKLKRSGLLFVDDTQLPGPQGLCRFMEKFPERWRLRRSLNKLSCYEKISDFGIDCGNHVDVKIFQQ
jgi:hypothetical protein